MPGANRRERRLKQGVSLAEIGAFESVNPQDGDILIYNPTSGKYENGRTITGDLTISGEFTAADILVSDDLTVQDALLVQGSTNLEGSLAVIGTATLNGNTTVAGTLGVTGAVTLSDALTVAGALNGASLALTGSGTIAGDLTVTGTVTAGTLSLDTIDVLSVTTDALLVEGNGEITGQLSVAGPLAGSSAALSAGLSVSGQTSTSTLLVVTSARVGNLTISDDLTDATILHVGESSSITLQVTDGEVTPNVETLLVGTFDAGVDLYFGGSLRVTYTDTQYDLSAFTGSLILPIGTNAQEPANAAGQIRWNTDEAALEVNDGTSWAALAGGGGGISNVVDDTTPQLGGSLDVNGNSIVSVTNGDIVLAPNGTGNVLLGNFEFDVDQTVGAGQDNYVLTYDNATGHISLEAASGGGGSLPSEVTVSWTLGVTTIQGDDDLAVAQNLIVADADGVLDLYYDGEVGLRVTERGASMRDQSVNDAPEFTFETNAGSALARITHFSNDWFFDNDNASGDILFRLATENAIVATKNAGVDLYYNGNVALGTQAQGAYVADNNGNDDPFLDFRSSNLATELATVGVFNDVFIAQNSGTTGGDDFLLRADNGNYPGIAIRQTGQTEIFHGTSQVYRTTGQGAVVRAASGQTTTGLFLVDSGDTTESALQHTSTQLQLYNLVHGQPITLTGETNAGAAVTLLTADPDTGIAFNGATAVTAPTYTVTNDLTDRAFDANTVAIAELADVVGTIIADLQANGLFQ